MHEMICPRCGTIAQVTPDSDRCPGCSQSLRSALPRDIAAHYFYERAEALVAEQGSPAALAEVRRGLAYAPTSELLLLGAILSEQQGAYDLMRGFVAEIPLEDSLREEAEWLLRSHQMRQRALRQRTTSPSPSGEESASKALGPVRSDGKSHTTALAPLPPPPARSHKRGAGQRVWPTAITLILLGAVLWAGWRALNPILDSTTVPPLTQLAEPTPDEANIGSIEGAAGRTPAAAPTQAAAAPAVNVDASLATGEPQVEVDASQVITDNNAAVDEGEMDAASVEGAAEEEQTEDAPAVAPPTSTPEPIVDSTPAGALLDQDLKPFDILAYLKEAGRPDLAQLSVDAQIRDGELIIYGVVPWAEHRRDILEATQNVPGVERVNSVDLRVRVPETYTVQTGDTLWIIAYRLYDDPARWPEIVSYNQALIPNPQSLRLGSTLQVPPAR